MKTRQLPTVKSSTLRLSVATREFDTMSPHSMAPAYTPTQTTEVRRENMTDILVPDHIVAIHIGRESLPAGDLPEGYQWIMLRNLAVSHYHLVLERSHQGWTVRDEGSTNGSRLQDCPIGREPTLLGFDRSGQCVITVANVRIFVSCG